MATVVKDLGAVTAYAYAVAGGYSGTEAEFEDLLGNIAEDLSEIENLSVTVTTLPAGSSATASYSNGVLSLGVPKGDKGDKGDTGATGATGPTGNGISTITKTGTSGLVDTYTITFTNGDTTTFTVTNGEDGEVTTAQMNAAIESALEDYAKVDGSYSSLTAGNAEQLVSTVGVNDKTPYLFRTTGGSADVGDRVKLSEITGGTVAWNQLLKEMNSANFIASSSTGSSVSITDGVATVTVTAQYAGIINSIANRPSIPTGHKVLCSVDVKLSSAVSNAVKAYWNEQNAIPKSASANTSWQTLASILSWDSTKLSTALVNDYRASGWDSYQVKNSVMFDLTAMFGSTIADYIYGLEQNTAGAGVAKLKSWGFCTKPYYAYNAGTLLSVKTSAHKEIGFNQWDEQWEVGGWGNNTGAKAPDNTMFRNKTPIKVVPNTTYYYRNSKNYICRFYFYDASGGFIQSATVSKNANSTLTTPSDAYYMNFRSDAVSSYSVGDICINLHWDGERDGEYEPYVEYTYALDSDLELRGIPKLDANNNLYYDGDSYAASGDVTRRYGIVDLGTLTYTQNSGAWRATISDRKYAGSGGGYIDSIIVGYAYDYNLGSDMTYAFSTSNNGYVWFRNDTYTTADAFKNAMSGVYFVYELATSTTETADPYQETQVCNDFGTEEFVDERTVPMPVGNSALYQANLRAKLEMAPDSPDGGDGDYIVRQTDGLNEYVAVSDNATISGLSTRCPACPTDTDGTFVLKATVSSGAVTYAWTAES